MKTAPPSVVALLSVFLVMLSVLAMAGVETVQRLDERRTLEQTSLDQAGRYRDAQRVREQFRAVAVGAAELAAKGNPRAQAIVERLAKAGITVTMPTAGTSSR